MQEINRLVDRIIDHEEVSSKLMRCSKNNWEIKTIISSNSRNVQLLFTYEIRHQIKDIISSSEEKKTEFLKFISESCELSDPVKRL